jgi:hypothetical protein
LLRMVSCRRKLLDKVPMQSVVVLIAKLGLRK